jgi:acetolactate synthase-1/2/3 large subunit
LNFFLVDIIDMTKSCTKWNIMVHDVVSLPDIINKAFTIAASDRPGPVLISLPINVTESVFDTPTNTTLTYPQVAPTRTLSATHLNIEARSSLSKPFELINNSKRPVIYVGQGIFGHPDGPIVMDAIISQDEDFHPMVNPGNSLDQSIIAARNKVT